MQRSDMIRRDYGAVAAHLWKHYEPECRFSIATADDAADRKFIFNQRWDMERTYEYVKFDGDIDFLHQPGNDPEWIYAFNRLKHFISLGQAFRLTGDRKYAAAFRDQMKAWILGVREDDPACEKAWRTIETGIRLDTISKAWLFFEGEPEAEEIRELFMSSVRTHAESILGRSWNSYHLMSNWGVLSNHGLYVAGVLFKNPEWEKEALRRLSAELRNEVYDDGQQWEQSPMYHNEVTRDYLDVVLLSRFGTIPLEKTFVDKVRLMALVDLKSIKADGTEPMMGDSDEIDMRDVVSCAAYIFSDPFMKGISYPELEYETSWLVGMEGIDEYRRLDSKVPDETDFFLSVSGNGFARTSWTSEADYLRFHCGTLGAGHGHADQCHVSFMLDGKDFLVDAGRYTYVPGPDRYMYKNNFAHNVVVLDGESLYPEKDSWECSSLDRAVNVRSCLKGNVVAFEGGHLGYFRKGVFLNRRVVWLKKERLLFVIEEGYSVGRHEYDQLFHFAEDIAVSVAGNEAVAGKVRIHQRSAEKLCLSVGKGSISRHYNQREENAVLSTKADADGFFSLWTVFDLDGEEGLEVELSPCKSNFKGIVFSQDTLESVLVKGRDREVVLVCAHEEFASPTDTFLAFDRTGFGNLVVFIGPEEKEIGLRLFG